MTRVLAINGSPRKDGNTAVLLRTILAEMEREGMDRAKHLGQTMAHLLRHLENHPLSASEKNPMNG